MFNQIDLALKPSRILGALFFIPFLSSGLLVSQIDLPDSAACALYLLIFGVWYHFHRLLVALNLKRSITRISVSNKQFKVVDKQGTSDHLLLEENSFISPWLCILHCKPAVIPCRQSEKETFLSKTIRTMMPDSYPLILFKYNVGDSSQFRRLRVLIRYGYFQTKTDRSH